jgi:hypothetical protein
MSRSRLPWIVVLPFILMLTGCTPSGTQGVGQAKQTPPVNRPTATVTHIISSPTLAPAPHNCPTSNPPRQVISSNLSAVVGTSPVWATWPPGPSIYRMSPASISSSSYVSGYGWEMMKVVWEVGPSYTHSVTISGYERSAHTPLFIQIGGNGTPTANAVLNPLHPDHPTSAVGNNWAEWGSYIVVPKAGCYSLKVSWPTGHWSVNFAFGA